MFKILTEFTGEIPLGVYRTDKSEPLASPASKNSVHVEVNDATTPEKPKTGKFDFRRISSKKIPPSRQSSEKWSKQAGRAKTERDEMNDLIEQRAKSLNIPSEKIHEVVGFYVPQITMFRQLIVRVGNSL